MSDEVGRITQLNQTPKLVGPPASPAEQVRGRLRTLEERLNALEEKVADTFNRTDEEIGALIEAAEATGLVVAALLDAVRRMAADPMNPVSAGAEARQIIEEATNGDEEPADDAVVREPAGDQTGDA